MKKASSGLQKQSPWRWVKIIVISGLALIALYFALQWAKERMKIADEQRAATADQQALQRVLDRNLIIPTPPIQIVEKPVVDPALVEKIEALTKEVQSLR